MIEETIYLWLLHFIIFIFCIIYLEHWSNFHFLYPKCCFFV